LVFAAVMLACGVAASTDIEKWTDSSGRVHYGDQPPADVDAAPIRVRPNVIEGATPAQEPAAKEDAGEVASPSPAPSVSPPAEPSAVERYVEQCKKNRGVDCEQEAREMIYGPAPVIFPGDPAIFPRPDIKPPPPGLPLKFRNAP
jgi:hypothetical protein